MMLRTTLLAAAALVAWAAIPAAVLTPDIISSFASDGGRCAPDPCALVNGLCKKFLHFDCLAIAESDADIRCMGTPCDILYKLCHCVG